MNLIFKKNIPEKKILTVAARIVFCVEPPAIN
jgi:hypothetical protein